MPSPSVSAHSAMHPPQNTFLSMYCLVLPQQPGAPLPDGTSWECWQSSAEGWEIHLSLVLPCWCCILPSSPDCSCSSLTPSCWSRLRWWAPRAGEQKEENLYFWYFGSWNPREKLRNVTWGQNVWLCSSRAERGRFIPIATPWPVSCRNFPAPWMCGGLRGTSPSLICSLQLCGRKMISEESAALHETRLRWGCVWKGLGVIPGTSRGYNSSCHCPPQLSFHALVPAESSPPAVHLAAMSFIPAAEFEKENFLKSSSSLETDAASALSR